MKNFNLDAEKAATIARLEAIERVGLDIKALNEKLANLDVVKLIEEYVTGEVKKIEKLASKHSIPLSIDTSELVAVVKVPGSDTSNSNVGITLPFVPADGETISDNKWDTWRYDEHQKRFAHESEWESSWESSSC